MNQAVAREAMALAGHKLPIRTRFVQREEAGEPVAVAEGSQA